MFNYTQCNRHMYMSNFNNKGNREGHIWWWEDVNFTFTLIKYLTLQI